MNFAKIIPAAFAISFAFLSPVSLSAGELNFQPIIGAGGHVTHIGGVKITGAALNGGLRASFDVSPNMAVFGQVGATFMDGSNVTKGAGTPVATMLGLEPTTTMELGISPEALVGATFRNGAWSFTGYGGATAIKVTTTNKVLDEAGMFAALMAPPFQATPTDFVVSTKKVDWKTAGVVGGDVGIQMNQHITATLGAKGAFGGGVKSLQIGGGIRVKF